jgi:ribosome maturation factor RimP
MEPIEKRIQHIVEPIVKDNFLDLFGITVTKLKGKTVLVITLDKRSGYVGLEECALISRELEKKLDEMDWMPEPYVLEITSPGLDRPLRHVQDCERFIGRLAKFVFKQPINGQYTYQGRLDGGKAEQVQVLLANGHRIQFEFDNVKEAKLVVEL